MNRIDELTEKEVLDLTAEQLNLMIDRACAEEVEPRSIHSMEQWEIIKDYVKAYCEVKTARYIETRVYKEAANARESIVKKHRQVVADARCDADTRDRIREEFARYLVLAEGNRTIALNFLLRVNTLEHFPELKSEFLDNNQ
jgi:hypothetical protein